MRLMIFIFATFLAALLTCVDAPGQERLPEVGPPAFALPEAAQPAFSPFEVTAPGTVPPESASPVATPLGVAPPQVGLPEAVSPQIAPPLQGDLSTSSGEAPAPADSAAGGPGTGMSGMGTSGAGMGFGGMGGPGYGATWYPSRPVSPSASDADLGLVRQDLSVALPIWRDRGDFLALSAGVRNSMFFTDAVLPESHRPFPSDLWNVSFGTLYSHKFDNGWTGGLGINFGSASDQPFHSINEMNLGFMSFLQVPVRNDRDAWRFSLMYSPVGNLNFPIPGVAYLWNPSDAFHASIGLPFVVLWRPVEDLTISLSYMPLITVNARATYRLVGKIFIFGGFESMQEAYLLADRDNLSDRFMGFEKQLIGGVRWDAWQSAALELDAGYAFDRYYGMGQNQIGSLHDQLNVAPGVFVSTRFQLRF